MFCMLDINFLAQPENFLFHKKFQKQIFSTDSIQFEHDFYRKFSHWVFHNYFRISCALQSDLLVDDKSHFRIFFVNLILLLPTKTIPKKCVKLQSFVNCGRTKATMVTISYESSLAMTMCNTKPKEHYNRLPNTTK